MSRPAFTLLLLLLAALLVPFVTASTWPADKLTSGKSAAAPQPSRRMGISRGTSSKGSSKVAGKRKPHEQKQAGPVSPKDFSSFLCPDGATACPVPAPGSDRSTATESDLHQITTWLASGFECIPTDEELNSCGGCLSLGQGQDCSAIPNTRDVSCNRGSCVVQRCKEGFVVGADGKTCIRPSTTSKGHK